MMTKATVYNEYEKERESEGSQRKSNERKRQREFICTQLAAYAFGIGPIVSNFLLSRALSLSCSLSLLAALFGQLFSLLRKAIMVVLLLPL